MREPAHCIQGASTGPPSAHKEPPVSYFCSWPTWPSLPPVTWELRHYRDLSTVQVHPVPSLPVAGFAHIRIHSILSPALEATASFPASVTSYTSWQVSGTHPQCKSQEFAAFTLRWRPEEKGPTLARWDFYKAITLSSPPAGSQGLAHCR
jgi:hypothetical protein